MLKFIKRNITKKTFWVGVAGLVDAGCVAFGVPPPTWVHGIIVAAGTIFLRDALSKTEEKTTSTR